MLFHAWLNSVWQGKRADDRRYWQSNVFRQAKNLLFSNTSRSSLKSPDNTELLVEPTEASSSLVPLQAEEGHRIPPFLPVLSIFITGRQFLRTAERELASKCKAPRIHLCRNSSLLVTDTTGCQNYHFKRKWLSFDLNAYKFFLYPNTVVQSPTRFMSWLSPLYLILTTLEGDTHHLICQQVVSEHM